MPLLCDLHLLLCDVVATVNTMFGWQLFVCLVSLFTHTVVTPYYLFIVVFKSVSPFSASNKLVYHKIYIFGQIVWVLTHLSCLIYLIYYSHKTTEEVSCVFCYIIFSLLFAHKTVFATHTWIHTTQETNSAIFPRNSHCRTNFFTPVSCVDLQFPWHTF